jgi:diguanylate cyclase (GGDEF)-like protein/putative nucleotidyltransferase with HDIG domain
MSRPRLSISLAVVTLSTGVAAMGAFTVTGGLTLLFELLSLVSLAVAVMLSVGVLSGFARPGAIESAQDRSRLEKEALSDSLTGLGNHRAFQEDLARELARSETRGEPLGIVLLDVDGLKTVNDTNGHQAGDELIMGVSAALRATLRQRDVAYRIGGDEFAVLLPNETTWGAFRFAQRLQGAFATSTGPHKLSASAGVSSSHGQTRDQLIREADLALIAAKRGRRGALIYTDDLAVREQGYESDRVKHLDLICTSLARAVDMKDRSTRGHSETVAELATLIATELNLPSARIAQIRRAALLHDVGKIGIPDTILGRPGPLDASEREIMETHTMMGHQIVTGAGLDEEARWVLHHHERVDGRGYPAGLVGVEIPLESSIIFVADAFEAMTADRPYRSGRPASDALAELDRNAGTQFRPDIVQALHRAFMKDATADGNLTSLPSVLSQS